MQRDGHRLGRAIDGDVDGGREVAGGGCRVARFGDRLAREAIEQIVGHVRVRLPADEADALAQHFYDGGGCIDDDAVRDGVRIGRGGRRIGAGRGRGRRGCVSECR